MGYIFPTFRILDLPSGIRDIWHSRNDEPEKQEFDFLPEWMEPQDENIHEADLQRLVKEKIESLTEKEQEVLRLRFWEDETLDQVAARFSVTRERIRQIEAKAIRKLKHPSRSDDLWPYMTVSTLKMMQSRIDSEKRRKEWEAHLAATAEAMMRQEKNAAKCKEMKEREREDQEVLQLVESAESALIRNDAIRAAVGLFEERKLIEVLLKLRRPDQRPRPLG